MINEPICIYINNKHTDNVMKFAEQVSLTTNYSDCGQDNYNLKVYQHYIGKLGELAVYLYLRDKVNITKPDFEIYHGKRKSWDSDLKSEDINISIKTQDFRSANRFGISWTFQYIKNGRADSSLREKHIVIPTLYDNTYYDRTRIIIFPSRKMEEIIFNEPKKESLKGKKLVMYAKDNYELIDSWIKEFSISS